MKCLIIPLYLVTLAYSGVAIAESVNVKKLSNADLVSCEDGLKSGCNFEATDKEINARLKSGKLTKTAMDQYLRNDQEETKLKQDIEDQSEMMQQEIKQRWGE